MPSASTRKPQDTAAYFCALFRRLIAPVFRGKSLHDVDTHVVPPSQRADAVCEVAGEDLSCLTAFCTDCIGNALKKLAEIIDVLRRRCVRKRRDMLVQPLLARLQPCAKGGGQVEQHTTCEPKRFVAAVVVVVVKAARI